MKMRQMMQVLTASATLAASLGATSPVLSQTTAYAPLHSSAVLQPDAPATPAQPQATLGTNLIANGDAEAGPGSADGTTGGTPIPNWSISGVAQVNRYNIPGSFIQTTDPGPSARGRNYFVGGPQDVFTSISQTISVKDLAAIIDTGRINFTLSGWLGGVAAQDDNTFVAAYFKDAQGNLIGEGGIGSVLAINRSSATSLLYRERVGAVPTSTRTIEIYVNFTHQDGAYNDALADNLSFSLYDSLPPLTALPPDLYRRALQHLESLRGSPMAPGWDANVRLAGFARPLFRPDLGDAVAYYDVPVIRVPTPGLAFINPAAGFIVLSTGEHDFPIGHWNFEGDSPTSELIKKANQSDHTAAKFFRMDALYYLAQDAFGNKVAENGTPVNRILNLSKFVTTPVVLTTKTWSPIGTGLDITPTFSFNLPEDSISHTLAITGPLTGTFVLTGWTSLDEMKDGYVNSYGPLIDSLKNQASEDWNTDHSVAQYGEALRKGDVYTLPMLATTSTVSFSGVGVGYVQTATQTGANGLPLVRITVIKDEPWQEIPLTATVNYPAEIVRFTIIPTLRNTYLPIVIKGGAQSFGMGIQAQAEFEQHSAPAATDAPNDTPWGPWNYFWAGNANDQRIYGQIPKNTAPNTSSCPSGCGGTAWAMLFGWADHQAKIGNPRWASPYRGGIYRQNGGYGADVDAPVVQDSGVINMTWEIRNRIGTWCVFGSAPTVPWDMDGAQGYLVNRSYAHVRTHYNVLGWHEDRLREYARDSIIYNHTPAIIGTGWLTHYPLAWGYAWRSRTVRHCFIVCWNTTDYNRSFYVNEGWPGNSSNLGWVSAGTWFAGEVFP